MMEMWAIAQQSASLSLSMYVLGYVRCGPPSFSCIFGFTNPCYEERNTPYITSLLFVVIMTAYLGAATINRFPGFIVVRFLQGPVAGPVLALNGRCFGNRSLLHGQGGLRRVGVVREWLCRARPWTDDRGFCSGRVSARLTWR